MKLPRVSRLFTRPTLHAALLVTVTSMSLLPLAYSQQEVDPSWFDPWSERGRVIAQPSHPQMWNRKPQRKLQGQTQAKVGSDPVKPFPPKSAAKPLSASRNQHRDCNASGPSTQSHPNRGQPLGANQFYRSLKLTLQRR